MIEKAIATPAGRRDAIRPWQFTALAALLEARDRSNISRRSTSTSRSCAVWPAAR